MAHLIHKAESYAIIGKCMEVHNQLGPGFLEIVYKDALEYEFHHAAIPFQRERQYQIAYKDTILKHRFYADFVVFDKVILEIKCTSKIDNIYLAQAMNYLKVSKNALAIIVNFGEEKLVHKRVVL